jgi:soluble lytic murein transglycosylase
MKFQPNSLLYKRDLPQNNKQNLLEVTLSRIIKISTFVISMVIGNSAYPNFAISPSAFAEDVPFQVSHSNEDYVFGAELVNIFTDLSKNQLNKKDIVPLFNSFNKSKSFSELKPTLERLRFVADIYDQDTFYKHCELKSKSVNEFTDSLNERIDISIDRFCRNLFLKRMMKYPTTINFSTRDLNYFKAASPFYATGENQAELISFLKYFKTNPIEHEKLSNIFIEKLMEFKIRPPSSVLVSIKLTSQFNQFLQKNLNLDDNSITYFQEEFQRSVKDIQEAIEKGNYLQAKQLTNGAVNFLNRNKLFISEHRAFLGLTIVGKAFFHKGRETEALEVFEQARTIAGKEEYSDSNFFLLWPFIVDKDFKGLKKAIDKYSLQKDFDKFEPKLQYWIAISESKTGDLKKAHELFNKIITNSPYSFYSIISLKELALSDKNKSSEEEILSKLVSKENFSEIGPDKYSEVLKSTLKRFSVWSKLGNDRFLNLEIRHIQSLSKDETFKSSDISKNMSVQTQKSFLTLNLIKLLNAKKRFISSFKVFQDSIDQNSLALNMQLIKQIFPLHYLEIVKRNSVNIDPLIVISLIRQESAFNPDANSGVGAKGLMQLMPTTAKRFNKKVRTKNLSNPEINVAIGTKYLKQLISRYDGNMIYALASYNAGENRIDRWRKDIFRNEDPLATIEAIPFEETRNYVKLIYRNYFFYNLILNKSSLKTPIDKSFMLTNINI